jgi:autotransporter translocation and assembly factor TamB
MRPDDEIEEPHEFPGAEYVGRIVTGRVPVPRSRHLPLLVVLGLLLPSLLYIAIGAVTTIQAAAARIDHVLLANLSRLAGRDVTASSVSVIEGGRQVILRDIVVAEAGDAAAPPVLAARRVLIETDLGPGTIPSQPFARHLRRIVVSGAALNLRRDLHGNWNLLYGAKPLRPEALKGLELEVAVRDSRLAYEDEPVSQTLGERRVWEFDRLSGTALVDAEAVRLSFDASDGSAPRSNAARPARSVRLLGRIEPIAGAFDIVLSGAGFSAAEAGGLAAAHGLTRVDGAVAFTAHIGRDSSKRETQVTGDAQLTNGRVTYESLAAPVTGISVRSEFDRRGLQARGTSRLAGQAVGVVVDVRGFHRPVVVADLAADRVSVGSLLDSLWPKYAGASWRKDLPGEATLDAQAIVSGGVWSAAGRVRSPGGEASGQTYRNVDLEFVLTPEGARVRRLTADVAGGTAAAEGIVRFADNRLSGNFDVRVSQIDLAAVGSAQDVDAHGRASAVATGTFAGEEFDAVGRVWAEDVGTGDWGLATAALDFRATPDAARIERAVGLGYDGADVQAAGIIGYGGELDLDVRVIGLDLSGLPLHDSDRPVTGQAVAYGRVGGTLKEPEAIFEGAGLDIGIHHTTVPIVYAVGLADREGVYISRGSAVRAGAVAYGTGSVAFEEDVEPIEGHVWFEDVAIGELWLRTAPDAPMVDGTLSGSMALSGTIESPDVRGTIFGDAVVVDGVPVGTVVSDLEYQDRIVHINRATMDWLGARVEMAGQIGPDGALDLEYAANGVRLEDLAALTPAEDALSGVVDAVGTIGGTTKDVEVFASVYSPDVTAYGESVGAVSAMAWVDPRGIRIERGWIAHDQETVTLDRLEYALDRDYGAVDAEASGISVARLVSMAESGRSPIRDAAARILDALGGELTGTVHAEAHVSGERERLSGTLALGVEEIAVAGEQIGRFDLAADAVDGLYTIRKLTLSNEGDIVTGSGTYSAQDGANVKLAARDLDLELVRPWLPRREGGPGAIWEGGTATFNVAWSGKGESRRFQGDLWVDDVALAGVPVDRIGFDDLELAGGEAVVRGIEVRVGENVLRGEAQVPLDVSRLRVAKDRPLSARIQVERQSIASLAKLSSEIRSIDGSVEADIAIAGSLDAPQASGYVRVEGGALDLYRLESALNDVTVDLEVGGGAVSIARCEGRAGTGGVEIGGEVRLDGLRPSEVDLAVTADGALVDARNLSGRFGERFRGLVGTRDATITGPWQAPVAAGSVAVQNASLEMVGPASERVHGPLVFPVNPQFSNVRISFGEGVWIRSKLARALAEGEITVSGSLREPVISGDFSTDKGSIYYFTTRFKIETGHVIIAYQPPFDPAVGVSLQATGREQGTDITMSVEGVWTPGSNLDVQLTSDPSLPRDEIFALLAHTKSVDAILRGGGDVDAILRTEALNVATAAALRPAVLFPFEEEFQRGLGLEEFVLGLGYEQPFMVSAEKRLFGDVSVQYNKVFSGDERGEIWRIFYRVGPRYRISWTQDRLDRQTVGVEAQYRF